MAEHEHGTMDSAQSNAAWGYFVKFWKYFLTICIVGIILLAFITL